MHWSPLASCLWTERASVTEFALRLEAECEDRYLDSIANPTDLVVVEPGNGFRYLFDLAGSLTGEDSGWSPRVVCAHGLSAPGTRRDRSRMAGFPLSAAHPDDRGHLISCAAGGGYDINLVPMDSNLNRGRSELGARFRAMETVAAKSSGSLYFIALQYDDGTDRPSHFDVAVQVGDTLASDSFSNASADNPPRFGSALRRAAPFLLDPSVVVASLDLDAEVDRLFAGAWHLGTQVLDRRERNRMSSTTGHIAESVAEVLLNGLGWHPLWHFEGPGRHGVDLMMLAPGDLVVAIEVKGTLVPGRIPGLAHGELAQMSAGWMDKVDNPGMQELGLGSDDVFGAVVVVNFADLTWRAAVTADFVALKPVRDLDEMSDLSWLGDAQPS